MTIRETGYASFKHTETQKPFLRCLKCGKKLFTKTFITYQDTINKHNLWHMIRALELPIHWLRKQYDEH